MDFERLQLISQGAIEDLAYHYQVKVDDRVIFNDSGNKGSGGKVVFDRKGISGNNVVAGACYMNRKYSNFDECSKKFFEMIEKAQALTENRRLMHQFRGAIVGRIALRLAKVGIKVVPKAAARATSALNKMKKIAGSPVFKKAMTAMRIGEVGLLGYFIHETIATIELKNQLQELTDELQEMTGKTMGLFVPATKLKCDGTFERHTSAGLTLKTTCQDSVYS